MHVFLLSIPRLEFAALIPKGDYVTLCLLGHDIDKDLIQQFLESSEVRRRMPPSWAPPLDSCHCSPKISMESAVQPFADRLVFVGDCGTTRLYKDGIGAAYRTAKAARHHRDPEEALCPPRRVEDGFKGAAAPGREAAHEHRAVGYLHRQRALQGRFLANVAPVFLGASTVGNSRRRLVRAAGAALGG